jgi:hypothetical protein
MVEAVRSTSRQSHPNPKLLAPEHLKNLAGGCGIQTGKAALIENRNLKLKSLNLVALGLIADVARFRVKHGRPKKGYRLMRTDRLGLRVMAELSGTRPEP